ncbi:MAG: prepilin-type N-terminal cleavage/methylation domain-containing protein [Elusimicrobiota bacterium]|jgi:prepilin-type N-terminal cleavage/methylation domain-containing protein|nr:prepilin-type N-terminal cleavage/methylation domain-containing protein [Elusimicrobiota bacterium]
MITSTKGFSLMELLVALFIGSMVTVALISMWRGASMQTAQGQRQAVVRNNLSIFLRGLHKDITEADLIIYPNSSGTLGGGAMLMGLYNAQRTGDMLMPGRSVLNNGRMTTFYYCFNSADHSIRRYEFHTELQDDTGQAIDLASPSNGIDSYISSAPSPCTGGVKVMDNVNSASVGINKTDPAKLDVTMHIYRDFGDKSVPVNIEFNRTFVIAGGA